MDTDFDTTQTRYADFLEQTPRLLTETLGRVQAPDAQAFKSLVRGKKRIFFTGVGSSMPAAWHGANSLRQQGLAAQFLPAGAILGMESLSVDDVVVLSSQGVNRADALLIIDKALQCKAALVLLTANRDAALQSKADLTYYFDPAEEKLFCRPTGVAANYALMEKLSRDGQGKDEAMVQAWQSGRAAKLELPKARRYIVLSSDEMMPIAWNVALALREGSGLHTELFDIETYGHGNYVGDLRDRESAEDFGYILVSGGPTSFSARSAKRITPFVEGAGAPSVSLGTDYTDTVQSGLYVLASVAQYVYDRNQTDGYNMNRPVGKEENRYYHELDSYQS